MPPCLCGFRVGYVALFTAALLACGRGADRGTLPAELSDEAFWRLSTSLSEPPGAFRHSDNLVSNELLFVHAVQRLRPRGGVYVGVGPEQNFSYIARIQPVMAFIIDIRQENRNLHLLYKALFESSRDRVEFVSRLFSREPAGPDAASSVQDLFAAVADAPPSSSRLTATTQLVRDRLLGTHKLPLSAEDLASIDYVLNAFFTHGPAIDYGSTRPQSDPHPSYQTLMSARDLGGQSRSFLASEAAFSYVKQMQEKNLIVPVVGDFGGAGVIDRIGAYVGEHRATISAFYSSNVEVYLSNQQMNAYCRSLAHLPIDERTTFISSKWLRPFAIKVKGCSPRTTLTWDPEHK